MLQEVAPKKAKLKIAEEEYTGTVTLLEEKRSQLRTVEAQLAELHQRLRESNEQKEELEDNVNMRSSTLMRAEKLIGKVTGSCLVMTGSCLVMTGSCLVMTG
jgi:dynein heavy chain